MRAVPGLPSLRRRDLVRAFEAALGGLRERPGFRVVQHSFQSNHAHFLVEADDAQAMGRGMKALGARLARAVNRVLGRSGQVLADRYHMRVLLVDPASSGRWFAHWTTHTLPARDRPVVSPARSWLLRVGWLRWGRIDLAETLGR